VDCGGVRRKNRRGITVPVSLFWIWDGEKLNDSTHHPPLSSTSAPTDRPFSSPATPVGEPLGLLGDESTLCFRCPPSSPTTRLGPPGPSGRPGSACVSPSSRGRPMAPPPPSARCSPLPGPPPPETAKREAERDHRHWTMIDHRLRTPTTVRRLPHRATARCGDHPKKSPPIPTSPNSSLGKRVARLAPASPYLRGFPEVEQDRV